MDGNQSKMCRPTVRRFSVTDQGGMMRGIVNLMHCLAARCGVMSILILMQLPLGYAGAQFQPETPDAGNALLYVYEPSAFFSDGEHNLVAINEKIVAEVEPGSYFVLSVPPGRISVTRKLTSSFGILSPSAHIGWWEGFVEVENFGAKAGHRYYVRFPEGVYVYDEEEALEEMEDLKLLEAYKE